MDSRGITIYRQPDCILPLSFFEGRFIPSFHPESLDYEQWWDEQIRRCKEGWTDGGYTCTGPYYYHLNLKKINMLDSGNRPTFDHPFYSFEDQELFNDCQMARSQGKGIELITGRGFGKSFDTSSLCEHEFTFYEATEIIVSASVAFFADQTWQKIELGLNSQPDDLRLNLLIDKSDHKMAGTKVKVDGKEKKEGSFSKLFKIVYDDDEGRTRGSRPNIHVWEEIGSWSGAAGLLDCVKATEPSWWRGSKYTCFPIFIGTGGQMKTGASKDARKMGLDPETYNLLSFQYKEQKTCKFYPAYKKFEGFYEKSGISDEQGAYDFLVKRRESKKKDIELYRQECQEFPFDIHEAFEESGSSNFDKVKLQDQYNLIMRTPSLQDLVERGTLKPIYAGNKIIDVEWISDPQGEFEILKSEHPRKGGDGKVIPKLYVSGCDSFDAAEDDVRPELSPGCIKVFKRLWKADETGRIFVANLTIRTRNGSEFYMKTLLLNMYFGCQMLYEHTNKGIGSWYITNNYAMKYLYPRPSLDKIVNNSKSSSVYGLPMPGPVKNHIINLHKEYIDDYSTQMWFPSHLDDNMKFKFGSKEHHETMAGGIVLMADTDMYDVKIKEVAKQSRQFPKFVTNADGTRVFA